MYRSPIKLIEAPMQTIIEERDNAIFARVQSLFDVDLDREELIRALQYDRGQYEKGYGDGKADALASIVRCEECNQYNGHRYCHYFAQTVLDKDFCSYGERIEGE